MAADATPARTKLNMLELTLSEHRAKLADVEAELAEMPARQRAARMAAIDKAPTQFSGRVGSDVQKLRDQEKKLIASRDNLVEEIAAREASLERVREASRAELRASYEAKRAEFDAAERDAWVKMGEAFAALVHAYNGVLDQAEARMDYAAAINWDNQDDRLELEPLLRRSWQQPFPVDLLRACEMLLDATADPSGWGVHGSGLGLDSRLGSLLQIMPDLRGVYRHGRLNAGNMGQTTSNKQAFEGAAPLGSFSAPLPARSS